jgi:hypothetical protein
MLVDPRVLARPAAVFAGGITILGVPPRLACLHLERRLRLPVAHASRTSDRKLAAAST